MLGDDANVVFVELLKQLLEILRNISNSNSKQPKVKNKAPKEPKAKFGKLSKKDFEKLKKSGTNFQYVAIPKDKIGELEKTVKDIGGAFFTAKLNDGNNTVIAVPDRYMNEVNAALKHITAEQLKNDPTSLVIKDGKDKIPEEDIGLTTEVLRSHDIPVYTFKSADGSYMNIVPSEFDGQYEKALAECKELKKQLENIEVTRYEQTAPLDALDKIAEKVSQEEAQELSEAARLNGLDIQFAKTDDNGTAILYPAEIKDEVKKLRDEYLADLNESEKYLIDISKNTVTMDINELVKGEDESSYFVRVPNTAGKDYLNIKKSDVEVINDGKTLQMELNADKQYLIYDENKQLKSSRSGSDLSACYNTKHKHIDSNTKVYQSGNDLRRIDLYNKEENKLISLSLSNANEIRAELLKQNIPPKTVNNLLADISKEMPENFKDIFGRTYEKSEIVYADVPNIGEYLAQSQLSQQLVGTAQCFDELPQDSGSKCCIFDKAENKYAVLPVLPKLEIMAKLSEMGYGEMSAKVIADKIISSYNEKDIEKVSEQEQKMPVPETKTFETTNPELQNFLYQKTGDSVILVQENEDNFKYMEIDKGMNRIDIEKSLIENFDIKDDISAAEILKGLSKEDIFKIPSPIELKNGISVTSLSTNCIEIANGEKSAILPKSRMDSKILSDMGISEEDKQSIIKSFDKAEKAAEKPNKQTLQELKNSAKEDREKINAEKGAEKGTEKESPAVPTSENER